jgi:lysyl-tRNA synthetase, class I
MHWSDDIVSDLLGRGSAHVIETGTSISGIPHVGNASDIIRGDCVRKVLAECGVEAKLIWVSDDSDPFRKVPKGMESLGDYLGAPVKDLPDPHGCHSGFVEHYANPFIEVLKDFGVEPVVYSATDLYREGAFNDEIKAAFDRRGEIIELLNMYRRDPFPDDWVPWTPICEKCGKISTTKVTGLEGTIVSYECVSAEVSGGRALGCGFSGRQDALWGMGKFPWRVEWAAKWHHFRVSCEPFGKDHASAGGSYETSKLISEKVFGWKAPVPVVYEFFTLNGAKISSSRGNVITLSDWKDIAEPEVLKYFMYKKINKARDINLSMLPNLVDEYDQCERIYHKKEGGDEGLGRLYQLSQMGRPAYLNVPYTLCAVLSQVAGEQELGQKAANMGYEGFDEGRLGERVRLAGNWVRTHGPEYLRFELLGVEESRSRFREIGGLERKTLREIIDEVVKKPRPEVMHKRIYEIARSNNQKPQDIFKAIYET